MAHAQYNHYNHVSSTSPSHRTANGPDTVFYLPEHSRHESGPPAAPPEDAEPEASSLFDLDTLAIFGRLAGLLLFVFALNFSGMPRLPYPFVGNLQDCDLSIVPEVWIEGSVLVAIMYGFISVRKIIFLIIMHVMDQSYSVDISSGDTYKVPDVVDGRGVDNRALDHMSETDHRPPVPHSPVGSDILEQQLFRQFDDPHTPPTTTLQPILLPPPRPPPRPAGSRSHSQRTLIGQADLGKRTSSLATPSSGRSVSLRTSHSGTPSTGGSPSHLAGSPSHPDQPSLRHKYTFRIYTTEEDSFRDDSVHCPYYILPCLLYHLVFSLWLGWACNPHLFYYTSDTEFIITGLMLFALGEGMAIIYAVVTIRGVTIDNRVILREGGEVVSLAGLALYSLTLPAATMAIVRALLAGAARIKIIDSRVF